ncbi:MAG TPA: tetratricopeptide repeat protein [Blastocatellia bacterium]|jgi:hypothetical protein|nr:tetratricopeptide repeat protein [Blastocatellia bacterium]
MVKQAKRVDPVNAAEGMLVRRGYILILDPAARAAVICGDGKLRQLPPGAHGCPCTQPCTPKVCGINYEGSTVGMTRGPDTDAGLFPAVISPRKTKLRDLRPAISWAPIAGAKEKTTYNVTLYGEPGKVIWTKDVVSATRLTYPDDEPPLKPGQTYKVVVTSEGQSSQQDRTPGLGFTTLTASQARALADEEIKIKELRLPKSQTGFLIANLYAAGELYSEAIGQLEDLYTNMKEAAVAGMLGDLYAAIGLNREAEKKYLEALGLIPANDLDGLGAIQKNLAQVYESLGIIDRARACLGEARKAYQRLGNRAIVNVLLEAERRLKKPRGRPSPLAPDNTMLLLCAGTCR